MAAARRGKRAAAGGDKWQSAQCPGGFLRQYASLPAAIGRTLGECQPGIGDWWLARRAEVLAGEGKFRLERDPERFYNSRVSTITI